MNNLELGELLAAEAERVEQPLRRAFKSAARAALLWPVEAATLHERGKSLKVLDRVGPHLEKRIAAWISNPPLVEFHSLRRDFLTMVQVEEVLKGHPEWRSGLRADFQLHTTWSDGSSTLAEMAQSAADRGYRWLSVTDHSKTLKIAGGLDEARLSEQSDEIARVNQSLAANGRLLRVLKSLELNLNPQGQGDMNPDSLVHLDLVLGSFHSSLRKKEDQTERYLSAVRNPFVDILGHPRGRIYNYRIGLTADWPAVFAEAAIQDKAIEVDGFPDRQDLNVELLSLAAAAGALVSLGSDAHNARQLSYIDFSAAAACRAGVLPERVINFFSDDRLRQWLEKSSERRSAAAFSPS